MAVCDLTPDHALATVQSDGGGSIPLKEDFCTSCGAGIDSDTDPASHITCNGVSAFGSIVCKPVVAFSMFSLIENSLLPGMQLPVTSEQT